jgi:hypothetical protein
MQQLHAVPLKCCAVLCAEAELWLLLYEEPSFTQAKCHHAPLSARFSLLSDIPPLLYYAWSLGRKLASQANLGDMPYCRCSTFDLSTLYFEW